MNDIQRALFDSLIKALTQQGYDAKISQSRGIHSPVMNYLEVRNINRTGLWQVATIYITQRISIFGPMGGPEIIEYYDPDCERLTINIVEKILGISPNNDHTTSTP